MKSLPGAVKMKLIFDTLYDSILYEIYALLLVSKQASPGFRK